MSWITGVLDALADLPTPVILLVAAAFGVVESGLGLGMVIPGETVVLVVAAALDDPTALTALFLVVGLANSGGDHVGYFLGRRYGSRLRHTWLGRRIPASNWDRAVGALQRYGAWAIFLTRLLPVVRTLTPATAGMAEVRYAHFLPASLAGAYMWSAVYVFAGAFAGASVERIETVIGNTGTVVVLVLVVLALIVLAVRRGRRTTGAGADVVAGGSPDLAAPAVTGGSDSHQGASPGG